MKRLIVLSAPPGSGKSTWAKEYKRNHPDTYIISSDKIRFELTGTNQDFSKQKEVWEIFEQRIHEYANKNENVTVILDALCDLNRLREMYVKNNPEYDHYILVLFSHTFEEIEKLNKKRESYKIVPDDALKALWDKFEEPTKEVLDLYNELWQIEFDA